MKAKAPLVFLKRFLLRYLRSHKGFKKLASRVLYQDILISSGAGSGEGSEDRLYSSLLSVKNPVETINVVLDVFKVPVDSLWLLINRMRVSKCETYDVIVNDLESLVSCDLRLRVLVYKFLEQKNGADTVRFVVDDFLKNRQELRSPDRTGQIISYLVVKHAPVDNLCIYMDALGSNVADLSEGQQIKLLVRLAKAGRKDLYHAYETKMRRLSGLGKLKVECSTDGVPGEAAQKYRNLEERYIAIGLPAAIFYAERLRQFYTSLYANAENYSGAVFDGQVLNRFKRHILCNIRAQKSLSFIRLGDGEVYGSVSSTHQHYEDITSRQELHWWGEVLPSSQRAQLAKKFNSALAGADILGVPTVLRLIKEASLNRERLGWNSSEYRALTVMEFVATLGLKCIYTEDQSNQYLFSKGFLQQICTYATRVVVVSGVKESLVKQYLSYNGKVVCIELPTHRMLRSERFASEAQGILPYVYEDFLDELRSLAGPGVVFLVSAGFIGKIFIGEVSRLGSVGLDLGQSVLDFV